MSATKDTYFLNKCYHCWNLLEQLVASGRVSGHNCSSKSCSYLTKGHIWA